MVQQRKELIALLSIGIISRDIVNSSSSARRPYLPTIYRQKGESGNLPFAEDIVGPPGVGPGRI
jgi:hypothetical protein